MEEVQLGLQVLGVRGRVGSAGIHALTRGREESVAGRSEGEIHADVSGSVRGFYLKDVTSAFIFSHSVPPHHVPPVLEKKTHYDCCCDQMLILKDRIIIH